MELRRAKWQQDLWACKRLDYFLYVFIYNRKHT
jgi:hypothetical protein